MTGPPRRQATLRSALLGVSLVLLLAQPLPAVQKSESERQLEFGVKVALKGSWNEAAFRFEKAVRADQSNARAHNNLGVALESLGRFDEAKASYEKALELDPDDEHIRQNHDRLMDHLKPGARRLRAD